MKKLSKNTKIAIIATVIVVLLPILAHAVVFIGFVHISDWKYTVDEFGAYKNHFETVADFCTEYSNDHPSDDGTCWFDYGSGNNRGEILYWSPNWEAIAAPDDVRESFEEIENAFQNKDAQLEQIEPYQGCVYFETNNGLYSVVYSPNAKPKMVDRIHAGKAKRIEGDWYHVIKK